MGKNQRFLVDFQYAIRKIIKQQQEIIGESYSEVIKNIVLFYFIEKEQLIILKTRKRQEWDYYG